MTKAQSPLEPDEGLSRPSTTRRRLSRPGTHDQSFRALDDEQEAVMPLHPDEGIAPPRPRAPVRCEQENSRGEFMADDDTRGLSPRATKSEKRQRTDRLFVRLTPHEKAAFLARADKAGMASAAFARAVLTGEAGPRAQRRVPADAQAMRQVLGHLGKTGSNLNQIARYLHTGGSADVVLTDIRAALSDLACIRRLIYEALGKDPDDARPVAPVSSADPPPLSGTKSVPPPPGA